LTKRTAELPLEPVVNKADPGKAEPSCATYGTSVHFLNSQAAAARQARADKKLLFLLHVSGNFEEARFT
jgi:hypothetical protein